MNINFIVDQIDECLILRTNEQTKKYKTYKKAMNIINKYLDEKQIGILRY